VKELGDGAVGGELYCAVADVEELGGDVALPQPREAFMAEDVTDCWESALVDGPAAEVSLGYERVGEGMGLKLQADLDDVEGGNYKSGMARLLISSESDYDLGGSKANDSLHVPGNQPSCGACSRNLETRALIFEVFGFARHSSTMLSFSCVYASSAVLHKVGREQLDWIVQSDFASEIKYMYGKDKDR